MENIIKEVIAYLLAFFLSPLASGIVSLIIMPIIIVIARFIHPTVAFTISGIITSFLTIWLVVLLFGWFNLTVGWLIISMIIGSFLLNGMSQVSKRGENPNVISAFVGDIIGLVIGGIFLIK